MPAPPPSPDRPADLGGQPSAASAASAAPRGAESPPRAPSVPKVDLSALAELVHRRSGSNDEPRVLRMSPKNKIAGEGARSAGSQQLSQEQVREEMLALQTEVRRLLRDHHRDVQALLKDEFQKARQLALNSSGTAALRSDDKSDENDDEVEDDLTHQALTERRTQARPPEFQKEGVGGAHLQSMSFTEALLQVVPSIGKATSRVEDLFSRLGQGVIPEKRDSASRFVDSAAFRVSIHSVILFNVVFMCYAADEEVDLYLSGPSDFVKWGEVAFVVAFALEFVLRLWRFGCSYWNGPDWDYNWLDALILFVSMVFMVASMGHNALEVPSMSWLRFLRLLKLVKVLRVLRVVTMFKVLRAIIGSIVGTLGMLFWSGLVLSLVLFTFGLACTVLTGSYFASQGAELDESVRSELTTFFGSVMTSTLSLYMCASGGSDWGEYYHAIRLIGPVSSFVFLVFIFFTQIAVLNIILGVFVNQAIKSMEVEREEATIEHATNEAQAESDLREVLRSMDVNGDGKISMHELRETLNKVHVHAFLDLMGLRPQELMMYYRMLSEKAATGGVDLDKFTKGCLLMKGKATKLDICALQEQVTRMERVVRLSVGLKSAQ